MPWVFDRQLKITKSIDFQYAARGASGHGDVYAYDNTAPMVQGTFAGQALTTEEVADLEEAAMLPWDQEGALIQIDVQGVTWEGRIMSLDVADIMGASGYFSASLTLYKPTIPEVIP